MKKRGLQIAFLTAALIITSIGSCAQPPQENATPIGTQTSTIDYVNEPVDGYVAVAPRILRSGQTETISVSLFAGQRPANGQVQLALLRDGTKLVETSGTVQGKGEMNLAIPKVDEGDYELQLTGDGFQSKSSIRVEEGTMLFLETDKPIYKPGQTMYIRVLTLDTQLKPIQGTVTIEVADAKGTKVFKKEVTTDEYGMTNLEMPLSTEPNLGVWKISGQMGERSSQLDVRVEEYVLPKYEVNVDLPKDWVLADEPIAGTVSAEYSYGKKVEGEVQIRATRYVGTWQEFANVTRELDGTTQFELPAVKYVSGVPGASGMGNVTLEVTVKEQSTGYEEKTTQTLSVAASQVTLRIIPESVTFKPSLPLSLLVVAETPDKKPVDANVQLVATYTKSDFSTSNETRKVTVQGGKSIVQLSPPSDAISVSLNATSGKAYTSLALQSGYSPSGSFILVEPEEQGTLKVGETARFKVSSTKQATNFYYEVLARGKVVFSDFSQSPEISFSVSPLMAPSARLLVYQILPTSEVAADYVPFTVEGTYPQQVQVAFSEQEVKPGQNVEVTVQTEGTAKVGLAAVDRSVFILAENRLNLQQVFDELEKLYQTPQAELHEARSFGDIVVPGAKESFDNAGVVVISNKNVPQGKEYETPMKKALVDEVGNVARNGMGAAAPNAVQTASTANSNDQSATLADVQRVRQFFPETWIWTDVTTDSSGKASKTFQAPDSMTTWMLRAVALSKQTGLGISEAQLKVLQPFFVQVDLPYSAIRGEQLPVKVALYNYQTEAEEFSVEIDSGNWFQLLEESTKTVTVEPNSVGAVSFTISPDQLGTKQVKITARSKTTADAIVKELIIEPEGVQREAVENLVLSAGSSKEVRSSVPAQVVEGSPRAYLSITGNYLTQTIQGLEKLIQMPYGCGEQNMILFAPNVFVTRYLKETGQMKPEVMAKAETLMLTGYQRELTYRRSDGSFSAFGQSDQSGSLWLTAFVLRTFAQAKGNIYIDESVLSAAKEWITKHQNADGSFEPVGFVHHEELLGGLQGNTALTAYLTVALKEAGEETASAKAARFLESKIGGIEDSYTLALTTYALELTNSPQAGTAYERLLAKSKNSENGLYWEGTPTEEANQKTGVRGVNGQASSIAGHSQSAMVETTAYATLALIEHGDRLNASKAVQWLVSNRNAYGGYGSTQDTVVGLQALTSFASTAKTDVDATVLLRAGDWQKEIKVDADNADVLQTIDVPVGTPVTVEVKGKGQVIVQSVQRYNSPSVDETSPVFQIEVDYSATQIEVDDTIDVTAKIRFTPPVPQQAGMVVLDIAVPTGFAPEEETISALLKNQPKIKRYDISERKVIIYIEDMTPDELLQFTFKARALYPVKAQPVATQAYSYYRPEWKGEVLGKPVEVGENH